MTESSEIQEFYDKFSKRVLVQDFYYINSRHEAIKSLCKRFVPRGAAVLEIGCGVGIISRCLGKAASRLVAVDISPKNIDIAREFAAGSDIRFEVVDVIEQGGELGKHGPFDVVLMADVIEHIAKARYPELFATIEGVLSESGRVILTFPSPEIQEYMAANKADQVQLIDESIELGDLLNATSLKPLYFSYCDIFGRNDYVHAVFAADRSFANRPEKQNPTAWVIRRLRKYRWRLGNLAFLRRLKRKDLLD